VPRGEQASVFYVGLNNLHSSDDGIAAVIARILGSEWFVNDAPSIAMKQLSLTAAFLRRLQTLAGSVGRIAFRDFESDETNV
jgi:hypothetical protein